MYTLALFYFFRMDILNEDVHKFPTCEKGRRPPSLFFLDVHCLPKTILLYVILFMISSEIHKYVIKKSVIKLSLDIG